MEKATQVITKITLALSFLCAMPFAQSPKVAVYVSEQSGYSNEVKNALRVATMNVLVRGGKYEVVERSGVIDEELSRQASGAIDDDQMVAYGRQAGARYICVSDITDLGSYHVPARYDSQGRMISQSYSMHPHQVSARIIDVETAQLVGLGVIDHNIQSGPDMSAAITKAVEKMLESMSKKVNPNLPKKAVYVQGGRKNNGSGYALYTYTLEALFTRSRYNGDFVVVERSEAFTSQINREHGKQRSGSVNDSEISRMGKQYGISEICIASIEDVMGTYNINARLVNVENASVENASQLRHLGSNNSASNNLSNLRKIAVQMMEDMIPRQTTAEELEKKRQIEAEEEEIARTGWMVGFTGFLGYGRIFNMNEIEPYFKSPSGQWPVMNIEFYKQNIKFLRFGLNFDLGMIYIDTDELREMRNIPADEKIGRDGTHIKANVFTKLYPADFLFLSGGAGLDFYHTEHDVILAPVFPVGGGIFYSFRKDRIAGFVVEGLYNIVPFKGRTAKYISINAGFKFGGRMTEEKKYVKEEI
jgi:hypothetical protein